MEASIPSDVSCRRISLSPLFAGCCGLGWCLTLTPSISRRPAPISSAFGLDRGLPVDRYCIEAFLDTHATDIRGRALELGDSYDIGRFGRQVVTQKDVLGVNVSNPQTTAS